MLASGEHRASLRAFAASLPDWLPVPLVLCVMNLHGDDGTLLERLRHGCPLPVHEVNEAKVLEPGQMYTRMTGALCVRDGLVFAPHVGSIDGSALLASAVAEHGGHMLAVLLEGTLKAAASAARKVIVAGGAVFAHHTDDASSAAVIRNGVARGYKSPENLAEAVGVVCMDLQRAV